MKFVNENTRLWCNLNTGGAKGGSCCSMFCLTLGAPSSGIPWWRLRSLWALTTTNSTRSSRRVRGGGGVATETGAETGRRRRAGRTRGAAPRTPASRARASRPGLGRAMHRQRVRGDKVLNMALIGQKSGDMFSLNVYHDFDQFVEMTRNVSKCFLLQVMDTGSHSTWWRTSTWRPRSTSG